MEPGFSVERVVEKCPFTLTGADFYALASDAMLNALKRKIKDVDAGSGGSYVYNNNSFKMLNLNSPYVIVVGYM